MYEIASGIGTPLLIDEATQSRVFGLYARVLVDVDLSKKLFNSVLVEREGNAFPMEVQYERQPLFCSHCKHIGHAILNCNKLLHSDFVETGQTQKKQVTKPIMNKEKAHLSVLSNKIPNQFVSSTQVAADNAKPTSGATKGNVANLQALATQLDHLACGKIASSSDLPTSSTFQKISGSIHTIVDTSHDQDITLQNSFDLFDDFEDAS